MGFAQNLDRIMSERNLTAKQIEKDVGISADCISAWRRAYRYPRTPELHLLAEYLGTTMDALFEGEGKS